MYLRIIIDLSNDAFIDDWRTEAGAILSSVPLDMLDGANKTLRLHDLNGNAVGTASIGGSGTSRA